ncbi:MAG: septal ring lytic transglycosylase RlpA family protein [Nostocaceae cyanobacterium]|nr:septal ring lytic transglycosylase RlpA family protein [Nostocaceae cyanobacterium]
MNHRLLWATTALLGTTLGLPCVSYAQQQPPTRQAYPVSGLQGSSTNAQGISTQGNFQSRIARVQPLQIQGRMAANLIVNNVPVLTFVGTTPISNSSQISPTQQFQLLNEPIMRATSVANQINQLSAYNIDPQTIKAVWQPGSSSLKSSTVKPNTKTAKTKAHPGRYAIAVQDQVLVEIDSATRLPDTMSDPAKDALQATNRLRTLLGNAPPLQEISGKQINLPTDRLLASNTFSTPATSPFRVPMGSFSIAYSDAGLASWYSFRDNGIQTASGEPYNEMDMTAAHRSLPFGTLVRVTNLQNFQSVVVRITDRGPYIQGRIIDLSTGAAHSIGMVESGVVPVQLDILTASGSNNFRLGN